MLSIRWKLIKAGLHPNAYLKNVRNVKAGISAKRIKAIGFGFSRPLYNPEVEEYQANENRRVEIYFIKYGE